MNFQLFDSDTDSSIIQVEEQSDNDIIDNILDYIESSSYSNNDNNLQAEVPAAMPQPQQHVPIGNSYIALFGWQWERKFRYAGKAQQANIVRNANNFQEAARRIQTILQLFLVFYTSGIKYYRSRNQSKNKL